MVAMQTMNGSPAAQFIIASAQRMSKNKHANGSSKRRRTMNGREKEPELLSLFCA
jgi:hypothetical protein